MSLRVGNSSMGSHLENAQGSEIVPRRFSRGIIEYVDGGDDDEGIPTVSTAGKPQPSVNGAGPRTFRNVRAKPLTVFDPSRP